VAGAVSGLDGFDLYAGAVSGLDGFDLYAGVVFGDRDGTVCATFGRDPYWGGGKYRHREWTEVRYRWPGEADRLAADAAREVAAGVVDVYVCPALRQAGVQGRRKGEALGSGSASGDGARRSARRQAPPARPSVGCCVYALLGAGLPTRPSGPRVAVRHPATLVVQGRTLTHPRRSTTGAPEDRHRSSVVLDVPPGAIVVVLKRSTRDANCKRCGQRTRWRTVLRGKVVHPECCGWVRLTSTSSD
jgi:hypothetical protein